MSAPQDGELSAALVPADEHLVLWPAWRAQLGLSGLRVVGLLVAGTSVQLAVWWLWWGPALALALGLIWSGLALQVFVWWPRVRSSIKC